MERKRSSGNKVRKIIRCISMILFLCVLILPQASWLILKLVYKNNTGVMEQLDYDLGENRELTAFPSGAGIGNITSELEAYYNDHAPYRSILISINRQFNSKLERAYTLNVQPVLVALADKKSVSSGGINSEAEKSNEGMKEPENTGMGSASGSMQGNKGSEGMPDGSQGDVESGDMPDGSQGDVESGDMPGSTQENINSENASGNMNGGNALDDKLNNKGSEIVSGNTQENMGSENVSDSVSGSGSGEKDSDNGSETKTNDDTLENMATVDVSKDNIDAETKTGESDDAAQNQPYFPAREMNGTIFGRDDWMFCNYDNSIGYYCGSNLISEQQMADRLSLMQRLQQICDSRGIKLQFMIAPNKEQVYSEFMPTYTIENSYKKVQRFVDYARQNSSIKIIYPLEELRAAKNIMSTYYKYDTHWNHYGSFIATQALYKAMGLAYVSPDSVSYTDGSCIWGLVITAGLSWQDYERDYDHIPDYKPEVELFNTEGEIDFIHTEKSAVYRTDSTAADDSRFVMIGDSFRLYMMPYLERDFAHASIAHRDNVNDVCDDIRQADILVVECVERLDDSLNGTILELISILEN